VRVFRKKKFEAALRACDCAGLIRPDGTAIAAGAVRWRSGATVCYDSRSARISKTRAGTITLFPPNLRGRRAAAGRWTIGPLHNANRAGRSRLQMDLCRLRL